MRGRGEREHGGEAEAPYSRLFVTGKCLETLMGDGRERGGRRRDGGDSGGGRKEGEEGGGRKEEVEGRGREGTEETTREEDRKKRLVVDRKRMKPEEKIKDWRK